MKKTAKSHRHDDVMGLNLPQLAICSKFGTKKSSSLGTYLPLTLPKFDALRRPIAPSSNLKRPERPMSN